MCYMASQATVGVRELRQNLSVYLARVKRGQAYTVTELETLDAKLAADVANRISKAQETAGGRNLRTGGGKVTGMEGLPPPQRVAIVEWDSLDDAVAFYKSKAWADLAPERDKAVKVLRRYVVEVEK